MENKELEGIKKAGAEEALEKVYDSKLWTVEQACDKAKSLSPMNKQKEYEDRIKAIETAQENLKDAIQLLNEMNKYGK